MLGIVIPYYNYNYFESTLKSLSLQTDKRFNVYIGNDNSVNNPVDIIEKYKECLNITYKSFDNNLGKKSLVKQWKRCIDMTLDETWIMLLGDDDVLGKNCVEFFYANMNNILKEDIEVVRFASQYINEDGNPLKGYPLYNHSKIEKATDAYYRKCLGQSRSSLSEHIFSKAAYLKNKLYNYPLAWFSDDRMWLEFTNFQKIYTLNEAVVSIRVTSNSITGKDNNLTEKSEAKMQFYEFLVNQALNKFETKQQEYFLLEYGNVLKENRQLHFNKACIIAFKLFKQGSFISGLKILNRFIKANRKYKK
ncbi:glycosyltransferase family 2 protein [Mariniflexile soesokkakense]|uniref:Glycosyltransferase family 2 protein n=1 Tax=Mariniflexile soesokkakense TaxID=1343160 RepID=A0ABV0A6A2_9FLAO